MSKGFSLHIALNQVDQNHYGGLRDLKATLNDAETMFGIAQRAGYERSEKLYNDKATSKAVLKHLADWAKELSAGDILFISYSGHGGQIDDRLYYTPDDSGADETWCLYDRQLLDDELFDAFLDFEEGVRILVVSDSCHSGTMTRVLDSDPIEDELAKLMEELEKKGVLRNKSMKDVNPYTKHFDKVYKPIMERLKKNAGKKGRRVVASVKLLAACQDTQVAYDGDENGRFTGMIKGLLDRGMIDENTSAQKLLDLLKSQFQYPTPNLFDYGSIIDSFDRHLPFLVDIPNPGVINGYRVPPNEATSAPTAWRNLAVNDGAPTPQPNAASVSVEFVKGNHDLADLLPLLPEGVTNIRVQRKNTFVVDFKPKAYSNIWDAIRQILDNAEAKKLEVEAEPAQTAPTPVVEKEDQSKASGGSFAYLPKWPPASTGEMAPFAWHLGSDYSQLAQARDHVMGKLERNELTRRVRIAHFDTGYFPSHPAIWDNKLIRSDLARSFVPGETNNKALDVYYGDGEVQGHGLGTLAILAGWKMPSEYTNGESVGYFGAVPCAEIVPMRLGDGVVILDSDAFVEAVDYAIKTDCEVITMSRGGKPSSRIARAVNRAYEAGIVIVTAAGNSIVGGSGFAKLGPRTVVWPARFPRVIPACGVAQNHFPYDFEAQEKFAKTRGISIQNMQGNWGPESAMHYALAAYTPNIPWAVYRKEKYFSLDGGGTSSATPQIAAAAALYIMEHRAELEAKGYYKDGQKWKKVEAVRRALFGAAYLDPKHPELKKYYGNGILKAMDALKTPVMDIADNMKSPESESSWTGWGEAIGLFLNRRRGAKSMGEKLSAAAAMEIQHVLMSDPALGELYDRLPFEKKNGEDWPKSIIDEVIAAVKDSKYCSESLRNEL